MGHQTHRGVRSEDVHIVDHGVDDAPQVGVVARHDSHDEVTDARDGVNLEDLWDRRQMRDDGRVALALSNLQRAEGSHRITERPRVDLWRKGLDDTALLEPVEPRLHRAPSDAEPPTGAEHPDLGIVGEEGDDARIEGVDALSSGHGHIVGINPPTAQQGGQTDQPHGIPLRSLATGLRLDQ